VVQNVQPSAPLVPATRGAVSGVTASTANGIIAHDQDRQLVENDVCQHVKKKIEPPTTGARLVMAGTIAPHLKVLGPVLIVLAPLAGSYLVYCVGLWLPYFAV